MLGVEPFPPPAVLGLILFGLILLLPGFFADVL
jgi:hypothetical protein